MSKIQGSDLMLFVNGKSIAFSTNSTLSINAETADTSNKDEGADWASSEVSKLSWEVSSENIMGNEGTGYGELAYYMMRKAPIEVTFATKYTYTYCQSLQEAGLSYWTPSTSEQPAFTGYCLITSLEANAPHGEVSTFSVTLTGKGALHKIEM